ncbi:hypothetical protein F2Q69_00005901 [Brassica cretica]|uniref:Uncharacterized protein n=1 Tax=Brassica cretica TaxID=69181 RepID=A0A8S9NY09_BRACR|nr:hypothetical protein F2Q69_00005901 [Brassica cretica]
MRKIPSDASGLIPSSRETARSSRAGEWSEKSGGRKEAWLWERMQSTGDLPGYGPTFWRWGSRERMFRAVDGLVEISTNNPGGYVKAINRSIDELLAVPDTDLTGSGHHMGQLREGSGSSPLRWRGSSVEDTEAAGAELNGRVKDTGRVCGGSKGSV